MNIKKTRLLFFIIGISFNAYSGILLAHDLTEKHAMKMIFGNYNDSNKHSIWKNMKLPKNETNGYFSSKTGIASNVFFQSYQENGKKKFFLLTKTIPIDIPFECHACLPLLSAAIFSMEKGGWKIDSLNLFLMHEGEYGASPIVKLIPIAHDKFGAMVESEHLYGEFHLKEIALLVPRNKNIENAHQETVYYDNFNSCGRAIQCAAYYAKIDFDRSTKNGFYRLKIKKFGTEDDAAKNYKAVPVNEESIYQLENGKYVKIS